MTTNNNKTTYDLVESVNDELAWTPNVNATWIDVTADAGAVTLSGRVDTYPEKAAAVRAACQVRGVNGVADNLEVQNDGPPRWDADIALEAANALERHVLVPLGAVTAEVHDHIVTLTGMVRWHYQREAIRRTIAGVRGVRDVRDRITLTPTTTINAREAKSNIAAAFGRNADLDAQRIHVEVRDARVTLTGTVTSWAEERQATYTAWSTPGVRDVENNLVVSI